MARLDRIVNLRQRMRAVASSLVVASAAIILLLGLIHLFLTFHGAKLYPRDRELQAKLEQVCPVLTGETTMWRAWIGFNASHSFGAILFGVVYAYLALAQDALLFESWFLLLAGLLLLAGYVFLAKRYWFSISYRSILVALMFYVLALITAAAEL
jgi:hypothetical protein